MPPVPTGHRDDAVSTCSRSHVIWRRMFQAYSLIWITLVPLVISDFRCPQLAPHCTCGETYDWLEQRWRTVTYVNCSYSGLVKVPDLSPLNNTSVYRLLLNNNNITEFNAAQFSGLRIKELVISKNPLKPIDKNAFSSLRHLERLDVEGVKIPLDDGLHFLQGMVKLKSLDLGYNLLSNKYKVFPPGLFANLNLTSLKTLTLQALQMSKLDKGTFDGIEGLEQLDVSYNFLPEFPKELRKLKSLKRLKLYHNEIMELKENTFKGMTELTKLLIGVNDIDKLEPGVFSGLEDSLEEINLYHNPLSYVPTEAIASLRKLRKLSLVKNNLLMIENGSFVGEYQLEELQLDENPRLVFDDEGMFHGIEESLTTLYIRSLNLEKLPLNILKSLKNLEFIDATDNAFRKVDKHFFRGLDKLTNIKLLWNKIKHVDHRAFRHLEKGVILDLRDNLVHNLSFILRVEPCKFKEVLVSRNRIKCDCTVEEVLHSGLVSWDVLGDCYVHNNDESRWYSFDDPQLTQLLKTTCNTTQPYATCMQSISSAERTSMTSILKLRQLLVAIVVLVCLWST